MTLENYWMIDLDDIKSVELMCKECGATETFPATNWKGVIPLACRNCQHKWIPGGGVSEASIQRLTEILKGLISDEGARGCQIRLRITQPK